MRPNKNNDRKVKRKSQAESSGVKRQKREKEETPGRRLPAVLWKGTPIPNNN
jgi:spore germination protein GerM